MIRQSPADNERRSVYVVDDDAMVRQSLTFLLRSAGYDVRPFVNGCDFIEDAAMLSPGCVLLDLQMPGLDGFAVMNRIRDYIGSLPVVLMTAYADVATAVKAIKAGACDVLEKPFTEETLLCVMEAAFSTIENAPAASLRASAEVRIRALSRREAEVLRALVEGLPNKRIADRLCLSVRTVEMHRSKMMARLGVTSLAELLRIAFAANVQPLDRFSATRAC